MALREVRMNNSHILYRIRISVIFLNYEIFKRYRKRKTKKGAGEEINWICTAQRRFLKKTLEEKYPRQACQTEGRKGQCNSYGGLRGQTQKERLTLSVNISDCGV
jgi:hypothetical protein